MITRDDIADERMIDYAANSKEEFIKLVPRSAFFAGAKFGINMCRRLDGYTKDQLLKKVDDLMINDLEDKIEAAQDRAYRLWIEAHEKIIHALEMQLKFKAESDYDDQDSEAQDAAVSPGGVL